MGGAGNNGNRQVMSLDTLLLNGSFLSLDEMVALYVKTVAQKVRQQEQAAKLLAVSRNTLKKKSVVI